MRFSASSFRPKNNGDGVVGGGFGNVTVVVVVNGRGGKSGDFFFTLKTMLSTSYRKTSN